MYLAPLNYDRFFKKVFSHLNIAKAFLEDFLETEIEEIEQLETSHFFTNDATKVAFDFRCKINGHDIIIDMQQWYKPDVVRRFYLYHCASTVLQLEGLPQKKLNAENSQEKRNASLDYRLIKPVLTLIWMVDDNLGFKESVVAYTTVPEELIRFINNDLIWTEKNIDVLLDARKHTLNLLNNKHKGLDFLQTNRLIFMFQSNIVKDKLMKKYYRWFEFAEKTKNTDNQIEDFREYKDDANFREMMRLIVKDGLAAEDLSYIDDEQKTIEMVERYFQGIWEDSREEGLREGREKGIEEGREKGIELGREEGIKEGIKEGAELKEQNFVLNLHKKGKKPEDIADLLDIALEKVLQILNSNIL